MIQDIINAINDGFNNLQKKLEFQRQISTDTTSKLIEFQKTITSMNKQLHNNFDLIRITRKSNSPETLLRNIRAKISITQIKLRLIRYMSLWNINIQQGVLTPHAVAKSLSPLLQEENSIVESTIKELIKRRRSGYLDAKNCQDLFKKCIISSSNREEK